MIFYRDDSWVGILCWKLHSLPENDTRNHDVVADPKTGALKGFALHAVDATGLVHALLLRIKALLLPIKTLSAERPLRSER
jgi:hypothetical protein